MPVPASTDRLPAVIRPIRPDDRERLRRAHARLSPQSRYRRFLAAKPQLSGSDARYLVDVDGWDHFALVATDGDEIVGVARFVRLPGRPRDAEFAIVVTDERQGGGLGRALLERLVAAATARGVDRLHATALAENAAIRALVASFAQRHAVAVSFHRQGTTLEIELPLRPTGAQAATPHAPAAAAIMSGCPGS